MKMKNIFRRKKSREIARDRLKILLISDRVNCSAEMIEMITKVISKYMKIDTQSMDIQITTTDSKGRNKMPALYANIPILDLHKDDRG